jgi:hypothetical protein
MNYKTARKFLIDQGTALLSQKNPDAFLMLLRQGKRPIPGQMTSLLLALKNTFDALQESPSLDRELIYALHRLAMDSRRAFEDGRRQGVAWPPLLAEDLERLERAVQSVFCGEWMD